MTARANPYTALRDECREWARALSWPKVKRMWHYKKETLPELYQRTAAADQLGFDVRLRATDEGLIVEYVKRPPDPPWSIRP